MKELKPEDFAAALRGSRPAVRTPVYLFYSSLWDAYVRDPALMVIPFDDHLAHRGDGVFETMKCIGGAVYNLDAHLQRLQRSAYQIGLTFRHGAEAIRAKVLEALAAAGRPECSVRVVLSRGPGGMGVSPGECPETALYVAVYGAGRPFMEAHPRGARLRLSAVPPKHPDFATVKTCNYIPNVLMRLEAEAWGVDFVVGADARGHITEGPTENVGIVSKGGVLAFPPLDSVLAGTTMLRVMELAQPLEFGQRFPLRHQTRFQIAHPLLERKILLPHVNQRKIIAPDIGNGILHGTQAGQDAPGGFQTDDIAAEWGVGGIEGEDLLLRVAPLDTGGEQHLAELLADRAGRVAAAQADELHGEGRTAADHFAGSPVLTGGAHDGRKRHAGMAVEPAVFVFDHGAGILVGEGVAGRKTPLAVAGDLCAEQFAVTGVEYGGVGGVEQRAGQHQRVGGQRQKCADEEQTVA